MLGGGMLVLRRRAGEAIVINGDVEIEIIEISRTRVKVGVTAPRAVSVVRKETLAIAAENLKALGLLRERGVQGIDEILRLLSGAAKGSFR
jgi:carbon storage regulator